MVDRSSRGANVTRLSVRQDSKSPSIQRGGPETLDGLPLMRTIDEAAHVLRISRTTAYKLVALHDQTDGRTGIPHVRLGSRLLVRRVDLAAIVGLVPPAG